jgi:type I restriction enzyme S subunit
MRISSELLGNAVLREVVRAPLASLEQSKSATTVIHLNKRDLEAATVRLPAPHELPSLKLKCDAIFQARVQAALESRTLSELRDALLPLLMSGQVRVRDAERAVEGVL